MTQHLDFGLEQGVDFTLSLTCSQTDGSAADFSGCQAAMQIKASRTADAVYTSSTASSYPSGCLLSASHCLTDAETIGGSVSFPSTSGGTETGHQGNGFVRITALASDDDTPSYTVYIKSGGSWVKASEVFVKSGGSWLSASGVSVKSGGSWQ